LYDNNMWVTVWRERDGQYGPYNKLDVEIDGVQYVAYLKRPETDNPKAPALKGKLGLAKTKKPYSKPDTQSDTQHKQSEAISDDDLPF